MKLIEKIFEEKYKEELMQYIIKNFCPYQFDIEKQKVCNGVECIRCWNREIK